MTPRHYFNQFRNKEIHIEGGSGIVVYYDNSSLLIQVTSGNIGWFPDEMSDESFDYTQLDPKLLYWYVDLEEISEKLFKYGRNVKIK